MNVDQNEFFEYLFSCFSFLVFFLFHGVIIPYEVIGISLASECMSLRKCITKKPRLAGPCLCPGYRNYRKNPNWLKPDGWAPKAWVPNGENPPKNGLWNPNEWNGEKPLPKPKPITSASVRNAPAKVRFAKLVFITVD